MPCPGPWLRRQRMAPSQKRADHRATYLKLQGGKESINKIINNLKVGNIEATIDRSQWLDKLAHGQAIANAYVRPVVFLSLEANHSYLPLRSTPKDSQDPSPIYLVFVNGNHWVLATVEGEDGVQPIAPVIAAGRSTSKNAKIWATRVMKGLALYNNALAL
ncbi:hypothetical protein Pst134EA_019337 [Puccinia striiformis f. sp. tritici]|uniref:hypothetical protein n=1 Tax=Puccinia striiformis f. sp. tritici TaxID=168172 RepID=UPI0020081A58|nr:hypothetical protein Pst134EA_019337 [Puccinia striiformis f. sp. tritici]KAH9459186.1 hypothetical protein Pst134EA_019337 [Puccinia striiformis f. sp. tritici]